MQRAAEVSGCHFLSHQYRMDPRICSVVSQLSYDGQLRTNRQIAITRTRARAMEVIELHNCDGEEQQPCQGTSYYNTAEAEAIKVWYDWVRSERRSDSSADSVGSISKNQAAVRQRRRRARSKTILVVCMYSQQVKILQTLLPADTEHRDRKKYGKYIDHNLRIVTVDGSQGTQADIVILSCVRSNWNGDIGHVKTLKRLNVALSRAKSSLHIFGIISTSLYLLISNFEGLEGLDFANDRQ
jgi:superfamily I DNA and/or RNA helicase